MNKLARAESVNVDLRKFVPNVREQVQVPLLVELRVMAALLQDLRATERDRLLDFLVDLVMGDHVRVVLFFRPPKRAELAVLVANVGVVDVAVDDVGGDVVAAPVVGVRLGQAAAAIRQRAKLRQRQLTKLRRLVGTHSPPIPDFLAECLLGGIQAHTGNIVIRGQKATRLAKRRAAHPFLCCLLQASRSVTVRLKIGRSDTLSSSTQKYPSRSNWNRSPTATSPSERSR